MTLDIPIEELRERLGMLPKKVLKKALDNTTHYYYLSVGVDKKQDPRRYYKYGFPELRYPRRRETVTSDDLFLTIKLSLVNT